MASVLVVLLKKHKSFCGSKIKILSPAKINLYLDIKGKYPGTGGFHRIESIAERISLCDQISIEIIKNPVIKLRSNIKSLETDNNLVFKAAELFKQTFKIPFGFNISLKKNIPIGAGLGGGSSNAASVLLGLNQLFGLKLKGENLYFLGRQLGSDVNFFLSDSQFASLTGRGEKVTVFKTRSKLKHFVIWPGIFISTKKVYTGLRVNPVRSIQSTGKHKTSNGTELTKFFNNANIMRYALKKGDTSLIKKSIFNALEKRALLFYTELQRAKKHLEKKGIFAKITGSGSAFYTTCSDISFSEVKRLLPKKWAAFEVSTF